MEAKLCQIGSWRFPIRWKSSKRMGKSIVNCVNSLERFTMKRFRWSELSRKWNQMNFIKTCIFRSVAVRQLNFYKNKFPFLGSVHEKISNKTFSFFMPWKFYIHSHSLPHQSIPHTRGQTWLQKNAHERENECLRRRRQQQIIEKTCCISSKRNFHFQAQLSGVRRHSLTRSCFYNLLLFLLCFCCCCCCYFFALRHQESEQSRVQNDHTGWVDGVEQGGVSRDMKNNIRTSTLSSLGGRTEHWKGLRLILINFSLKLFSLRLNPLPPVFIQLSSSESAMNYEHLNYFLITMFNNIWNSNSCVWVYTRRFIHVKRWNVEGKWAEPREW